MSKPSSGDGASFARLLATSGVVETVELRAAHGFLALHGGGLERGTAELATDLAAATDGSRYVVEQPEGLRVHVASHRCSPRDSPRLARFLAHVDRVVSLHGYGRPGCWTRVLVGGADRELAATVAGRLRPRLPDFDIVDDVDAIPSDLRGLHPANPVNMARGGGVQIELPPRVRGHGPRGRPEYRDALLEGLAEVFR